MLLRVTHFEERSVVPGQAKLDKGGFSDASQETSAPSATLSGVDLRAQSSLVRARLEELQQKSTRTLDWGRGL